MSMTKLSIEVDATTLAKAVDDLEVGGLTVEEAVNIFLRRIANDQVKPEEFVEDLDGYRAWVDAMVQEALDDPRPTVSHEEVMVDLVARYRLPPGA